MSFYSTLVVQSQRLIKTMVKMVRMLGIVNMFMPSLMETLAQHGALAQTFMRFVLLTSPSTLSDPPKTLVMAEPNCLVPNLVRIVLFVWKQAIALNLQMKSRGTSHA